MGKLISFHHPQAKSGSESVSAPLLHPQAMMRVLDLLSGQISLLAPSINAIRSQSQTSNKGFDTILRRALVSGLTFAEDLDELLNRCQPIAEHSEEHVALPEIDQAHSA